MTATAPQENIVRTYLKSMEAGDLDATVACFDPEGVVHSPVYGEVPVAEFYRKLFDDTISASVRLRTLYGAVGDPGRWAAHFAYEWVRKDDVRIDTDLVDLFEFSETSGLIKSLRIIFDR
ncbi:hypothetical protein A0J57_24875 [Sphingobium sp. 22B]|uniref:nuclear transport factor 2 family protein n=1 Tax=unclassified Sphingobium TaxID=2611147 RepID=UPI000780F361|nr:MULTISPECIES: nuclear transport factor 2 family protein [unclassified Sphingobium]KXU30478.1 hypothetical protein AXW74_17340 [Sphingobium sp. AM]KYC29635.1 hypothetical protein A0J57_24875 [Sphingobium sp. 22B]OAP32991.1 hypothetical protein A8O16_03630 [Sphingobium sp. 20006FA]